MSINANYRTARGDIARAVVAKQLGIHLNTLKNWEDGKTEPGETEIVQLAKFYDCSVEWIMGIKKDRTPFRAPTEAGN